MKTNQLHVVLGAGQIGTSLADSLLALGHSVRLVRRTPMTHPLAQSMSGDVANIESARKAVEGAQVVYHCMNPPYHRWQQELPPLQQGLLTAMKGHPGRLVVLDNLYMFGNMGGQPMKAGGLENPCSKKGALRKHLAEVLLASHRQGDTQVAIGRASDFVGPGITQAHLGARFFERVFKGQAGECLGDASLPHAFTYSKDVVAGLIALGSHEKATGRIWHLPTLSPKSMNDWAAAIGAKLHREVRVKTMPSWLLNTVGLVVPVLRELREMRYQWNEPYVLDDAETRAVFGLNPVEFDTQVEDTAAWAQKTFGPKK